ENPATAWSVIDTGWSERTDDFDSSHSRNAPHTPAGCERPQNIVGFRVSPGDERDADLMWTRLQTYGNILKSRVDRGRAARLQLIESLTVFFASNVFLKDLGTIDREDQ